MSHTAAEKRGSFAGCFCGAKLLCGHLGSHREQRPGRVSRPDSVKPGERSCSLRGGVSLPLSRRLGTVTD